MRCCQANQQAYGVDRRRIGYRQYHHMHRKTLIRYRIETKRSQHLLYKESLGHTDLRTTEAYLASFEKEERTKNPNLLTSFL